MEITTEILPAREYLAIPGYHPWVAPTPQNAARWEKRFGHADATRVDALKARSGGDAVYLLFCNTCVEDREFSWVCGADIACENKNRAKAGKGFKAIRLAASLYCKITFPHTDPQTAEAAAKEADEHFWNNWLPANPFTSKIEGDFANAAETAAITLIDPENSRITVWNPIAKKA